MFHDLRKTPLAKIRLWVGIVIAVGALALLGGIALLSSVECTKTSTKSVEERIAKELPLASTTDEVIAWLDANSIEHYGPRSAGEYSILRARGIPATADVIEGFIPNTGFLGLATTKNITVFFVFTPDGRLGDVVVIEGHTAL